MHKEEKQEKEEKVTHHLPIHRNPLLYVKIKKGKNLSILFNDVSFYQTASFQYIAKLENLFLSLHFNGHLVQLCHDLFD